MRLPFTLNPLQHLQPALLQFMHPQMAVTPTPTPRFGCDRKGSRLILLLQPQHPARRHLIHLPLLQFQHLHPVLMQLSLSCRLMIKQSSSMMTTVV
jgi:hypothetical protein